jgi:hypothetical protein
MGFRRRESDLERRLRAERPQPRDEFVRSLSKLVEPARPARRVAMPKLALVGALTVVLAASLGVTGALGSAGGSVHSFSLSIAHLIAPAKASPPHVAVAISKPTTRDPSQGLVPDQSYPGETNGNQTSFGNATPTHYPSFQGQYGGFKIPICYQGHIIYVSLFQLFYYYTHGGLPAFRCHHHP